MTEQTTNAAEIVACAKQLVDAHNKWRKEPTAENTRNYMGVAQRHAKLVERAHGYHQGELKLSATSDVDESAERVEKMRRDVGLPPLSAGDILRRSGCGQSPELRRLNELRANHHLPPVTKLA